MTAAQFDALLAASRCFGGATLFGWTLDLSLTLPLALAAGLYATGTARLWTRAGIGHGARWKQVACFTAGWLALGIALLSPLHEASRTLFTAHMIEHEVLMIAAAPLLVLARPLPVMLWALPLGWMRGLSGIMAWPAIATVWAFLSAPLIATVLHGIAIWAWHMPVLFEAALLREPVHWAQHLSFLVTALLFWWALFYGHRGQGYGASVGHLFATAGHTGLLGVLIALSPHLWFPLQVQRAAAWGLTPMQDQELAGLVMWIPSGLVYALAALAMAALWIRASSRSCPAFS